MEERERKEEEAQELAEKQSKMKKNWKKPTKEEIEKEGMIFATHHRHHIIITSTSKS